MATPSGQISFSNINTELTFPATQTISLNDAAVRNLAGVPSGVISMTNLQNKSSTFLFSATIAAPVQNYNLRSSMISAGYPGTGAFVANVTVGSGVYVWSDSTSIAALDTGALSGGAITIVNNGNIMGKGGAGGNLNGFTGGDAINLQHPATITNNSNIGGGGGGGGTAPSTGSGGNPAVTLDGGGGGQGGGAGAAGTPSGPGAGGAIGLTGANGSGGGGGGGGRVFPGVGGGSPVSAGPGVALVQAVGRGNPGGGGGAIYFYKPGPAVSTGVAGAGGAAGVAGGTPTLTSGLVPNGGGGGGGFGAAGGLSRGVAPVGTGGTGGSAIKLNGNIATRPAIGNTYGAVA